MKTAISLPDELFERASRQAESLGLSRSELFARAVQQYLDEHESASLTARINEALQAAGADDSAAVAARHGRKVLEASEW